MREALTALRELYEALPSTGDPYIASVMQEARVVLQKHDLV